MCTTQQAPGKFEGETCITHMMYLWASEGVFDHIDDTSHTMVAHGPFTTQDIADTPIELCVECVNDVLSARLIQFWEDDNGFAYSQLFPLV